MEEGTLAAIQGVPKSHQGMIEFPLYIIAENILEDCGNMLFHDPGSSLTDNIEKESCTALSKSSSEERRTHSSWDHTDVSFIWEAMKEAVRRSKHLEMRNIFSSLDDTFSMSMP